MIVGGCFLKPIKPNWFIDFLRGSSKTFLMKIFPWTSWDGSLQGHLWKRLPTRRVEALAKWIFLSGFLTDADFLRGLSNKPGFVQLKVLPGCHNLFKMFLFGTRIFRQDLISIMISSRIHLDVQYYSMYTARKFPPCVPTMALTTSDSDVPEMVRNQDTQQKTQGI